MRRVMFVLIAAAWVAAGLVRAGEAGGQAAAQQAPEAAGRAVPDRAWACCKTDLRDDRAPRPAIPTAKVNDPGTMLILGTDSELLKCLDRPREGGPR